MTRPISEIIEELQTAITAQTEAREDLSGKPRHVSKMAKNVSHGDLALIAPFGFLEVNVWAQWGDSVTLGKNDKIVTVSATQRIKVRRA